MADRYIPEHRRTQFKAKNTFKPDELRRRREEQQVEIRKAKREENLAKRRGIGTGDQRPGASLGAAPDSDDDTAPSESQVSHVLDFLHPMRFPPCLLAPGYCLPLTVAHLAIYSPLPSESSYYSVNSSLLSPRVVLALRHANQKFSHIPHTTNQRKLSFHSCFATCKFVIMAR